MAASTPRASADALLHGLATVCLLPLLLVQARRVRRATPRLSEPAGPRSGIDGSGPALRVLIVGDSAAAGVGAATQEEALSGRLIAALRSSFRVSWTLSAQTGHTSSDLLDTLRAAAAEPFDVVLVSIGVNDVTGRTASRTWVARQTLLIELFASKFAAGHVIFSGLPPMHAFPALPQPLRWYLGARARRLHELLRRIVATDSRCELLEVEFPLTRAYMAPDGFHPGPAAYALWAHAAAQAIRQRVRPAAR
jgi:lysophospholipase L1-like esterase